MRIIINLISWLKRQIRDQLGFTYTETNGMLLLLLFISCLLAIPPLIRWYDQKYNAPNYEVDLALLNSTLAWLQAQQLNSDIPPPAAPPLPTPITKQSHPHPSFDINAASAQQLQTLAGIGPTRSARIIKYRDQLGGFVRQDQYREVYGLDAVALNSLLQYAYIAAHFQPTQLHINQPDFKTLLRHPYLSYDQVKKLVRSREKDGKFNRLEELLQRGILDEATFGKIKAYLAV